MASLIHELIDTLNEQNNIYESLLDVASKKKVTIIQNDVPTLQQFIKDENLLIGRNQRLEKKRLELFYDIATVLGKPLNITLKQIIEAIKDKEGEKELIQIREKMLQTLPKLKAINDQNQELLQMSMDFVDFSINVIRSSTEQRPTYYDMLGNEINSSDTKMFDAKQ